MKKRIYSAKYVGFGLILGVAIGFGFGLIITNPTYAPVFAGAGAGIGIVIGSIIGHYKIKEN